jgi:hypothetical protein
MDIRTLYGQNGTTTQTGITPIPNYVSPMAQSQTPQLPNTNVNFEEAMRRRAELESSRERDAQRMRDLQFQAMQQQMARDKEMDQRERMAYNQRGNQGGETRAFDAVDFENRRAALAQARAMSGPAPMRAMTGFNQIGSASGQDVLDPSAMSGAQRRAFLPNSSQSVPDYGEEGQRGTFDPLAHGRSRNRDYSGADWRGMGRG